MSNDTNTMTPESGPYRYHRSTSGCVAMYIIEHVDGTTVLGLYFSDNEDQVEAKARAVVNALNMPGGSVDQLHVIRPTLREHQLIATFWSVWDVIDVRPSLVQDQAWEVLQQVEKKYSDRGRITKNTLRREAKSLFPTKTARSN